MRPLTYADTVEAKPFVRKIKGVGKLTIPLWSAMTCLHVFEKKKVIDNLWDNVEKGNAPSINAMASFNLIIKIIYDLAKKPKLNILFRHKFYKWARDNTGQILSIWEDLIKANTAIFFLMKHLRNCEMVPSEKYSRTGLQSTPEGSTPKPRHGSLSGIYEKMKKPKSSVSTTPVKR